VRSRVAFLAAVTSRNEGAGRLRPRRSRRASPRALRAVARAVPVAASAPLS